MMQEATEESEEREDRREYEDGLMMTQFKD